MLNSAKYTEHVTTTLTKTTTTTHTERGGRHPPQDVRHAIHAAPRNKLFAEATSQHQHHEYSKNYSRNSNGIGRNIAVIGTATDGSHNTSARTRLDQKVRQYAITSVARAWIHWNDNATNFVCKKMQHTLGGFSGPRTTSSNRPGDEYGRTSRPVGRI